MFFNKKFIKNIGTLSFALVLLLGMLIFPKLSVHFALSALNLWFTKMIPTLFPFMVLSGILIRMNLVKPLCSPLRPLSRLLFGVEENGIFCIIIGFLCGFPMGAKVISDLYKRNEISLKEAEYLLSFCNNIGPIYFCGYVLVTLQIEKKLPFLFGMYGIPLLYGVLRHHIKNVFLLPKSIYKKFPNAYAVHCASIPEKQETAKLMDALDGSIISGIENITKLGGYMIFFNLFNMLPRILMQKGFFSTLSYEGRIRFTYFFSCFFEISNGVNLVNNKAPILVLTMLSFGGICCMAQTYSLIKDTPLSIVKYGLNKLLFLLLTGIYYLLLFRIGMI